MFVYEFASANRLVNMGKPEEAGSDTWMGTNNGHWEGDTLVVDVTGLNGLAWFDRAGDFASKQLHVVERFTRTDPYHLNYEATIEDPSVFTRPWKISMPLYRKVEKNAQLLEFKCVEFAEELLYGQYKKQTEQMKSTGTALSLLAVQFCWLGGLGSLARRPRRPGAIPIFRECGRATWASPCSDPRASAPERRLPTRNSRRRKPGQEAGEADSRIHRGQR